GRSGRVTQDRGCCVGAGGDALVASGGGDASQCGPQTAHALPSGGDVFHRGRHAQCGSVEEEHIHVEGGGCGGGGGHGCGSNLWGVVLTFVTIAHIAAGAPLGVSGAPCRVTERSGVGEHSTQCSGSGSGAGALDVDQGGSVLLVLLLVGDL